ncbi:MAG: hypothetical protein J5791_02430 [Fibrobacter sp.]|nr:hypothetical protein [Fibrobacter sp.]
MLLIRKLFACLLPACLLLACGNAETILDNPDVEDAVPVVESSSSSSLGRFDPQYGADSSLGEPVDTAGIVALELGACTDGRKGDIARTTFCGSTCYVICDSSQWRYATMDERDVEGFPADTIEGAILKGKLLSLDRVYVFEDGIWRPLTFVEKNLGYCDSAVYDKIDSVRGSYYYCMASDGDDNAEWAEISAVQTDYFLLPDSAEEEDLSYGARSGRYFLFRKGNWHMAIIEDILGYCFDEREGLVFKFANGYVVCRSDMWVPALREDVLGKCNEMFEGSIRRVRALEFRCDSGTWVATNLHSHAIDSAFYWDASVDDLGQVRLDSATKTAGYFYEYTDLPFSGNSSLVYPMSVNTMGSALRLAPLIAEYQGISVAANIDGGYSKPFAGLGFNLWNGNVWSDSSEGVDIRHWKGLCIAYESEAPLTLAIAPEGGYILEAGNFHKVRLEARSGVQVVEIPFEEFVQDSGYGNPESLDVVLASAASILFYVESSALQKFWFTIDAIGSLHECSRWREPGIK